MPETLLVSNRGQITLPASMRKHLGIEAGAALIIEECGGTLTLKPAAVLEIEHYSDEQIARWDNEDTLDENERKRILDKLRRK
jgi:antitoxin PrlF